ncbi:MAG: glutamyl-tRNA reductase [Chloroflexi bacterium]|nr:glutamyl-tRNA reductase [Chloroflexota bacterium]
MHILCLGLNHQTAPLDLRERLVFCEDTLRAALSRLGCGESIGATAEMVILSTCNRVEIYAASSRLSFSELEAFLSEARGIPAGDLHAHLYRHADSQAIRHLLNVAAGLDSLVMGEPQILGQVTRALELARGAGASGPLLNRLFQRAIHAGKRARAETSISRNPASVASLAASLAERSVRNLGQVQVVILGAGEMAELAVESLRKRGASKVLVLNRTLDRAEVLARRWQAEASTFERLDEAVAAADVLISSTGAPHTIILPGMVERIMAGRISRPLVMIDIAVPRDIDPACGRIPGVRVYDMDSLHAKLEQSLAERRSQVPQVEAILAEEGAAFMAYFHSLDMLPLIAEVRQQAETIRRMELDKTLRRLPGLSEAERDHIEALTQALVKKLLHNPTTRLRAEAATPLAPEYAVLARALFALADQ